MEFRGHPIILICIGLLLLPQASNGSMNKGSSVSQTYSFTGCSLYSYVETTWHCFIEEDEKDNGKIDDSFIDDDVIDEASNAVLLGDDGTNMVLNGAICLKEQGMKGITAVKCMNGVLHAIELPRYVEDYLRYETARGQLHRVKRGWLSKAWRGIKRVVKTAVTVVKCILGSCFTVNQGGGGNSKPQITCPAIDYFQYTERGLTEALVRWDPAQAHDPEDGALTPVLINSPGSPHGVWLSVRDQAYTVSYLAHDSRGAVNTCTKEFKVDGKECHSSMDSIPYGEVTCTADRVWGSRCDFTCHEGYQLIGLTNVTCEDGNRWAGTKPECQEYRCAAVPDVEYGSWLGCSRNIAGSTCTLTCQNGFVISGSASITCLSRTEWSDPGECQDVQKPTFTCPDPITTFSEPKKEPVAVYWDNPSATDNSDDAITVTSSSAPGDLFPVGETIVTFTASDTSGNSHTCSMTVDVMVKRCEAHPSIEHANVSCSHERAVGSVCSVTCIAGFHLEGVSERQCLDAQQWSNSLPSCARDDCGSIPVVSNGILSCPSGTLYESVCTLKCNTGFEPVGPLTSVCNEQAQWSNPGTCEDRTPPEFVNGCPGDQMEAAPLGQITYLDFDEPQARDGTDRPVTVTSDPPKGTEVSEGTYDITVVATDEAGNSASCTMTVEVSRGQCQDPFNTGLDQSEDKLMNFTCPDGHGHGAQCQLSCTDGNPVQGGITTISCEKSGTEFQWFTGNVNPRCEDNVCPVIQPPENGATSCFNTAGRTVCSLLCEKGYAYPKVDGLDSGSYICDNGVWVPRNIEPDICLRGRPPNGQTLMPSIYYYNDDCSGNNTEIKENFLQIVNDSSILKGLCGTANVTCEISDVTVTCGGDRRKRSVDEMIRHHLFRRQTTIELRCAFTITLVPDDPDMSSSMLGQLVSDINDMYYDNTVAGKYDMDHVPGVGTTDSLSYENGVLMEECEGARQPRTTDPTHPTVCVPCGKGYIYTGNGEPCQACPAGTYQPVDEASECINCPGTTSTRRSASTDVAECLELCFEGSYSISGREPCDPCPFGTYQSERGQTSCDSCPFGMATSRQGASLQSECQLYEMKMNADTPTEYNFTETNSALSQFTLLAFVRSPSNLLDSKTTFSLTPDSSAGTLDVGGVEIFVEQLDFIAGIKRQFQHVGLVYNNGQVTLYVDGQLLETVNGATLDHHQVTFQPGQDITELKLHGLQMVDEALTEAEILSYSQSCDLRVLNNILQTDKPLYGHFTLGACDAINECVGLPCGDFGVCVDLMGTYRCDCDPLWAGDNCEIPPNFCQEHKCANGAECVNDYDQENYTCSCTADFRGPLCQEPVVHGGWNAWLEWGACDKSCNGTRSRVRLCDSPAPGPGGLPCSGNDSEEENCNVKNCPVDAEVSTWSQWVCPVTCNGGVAHRSRTCIPPEKGGTECPEELEEYIDCAPDPCPVPGGYTQWSSWSTCSQSCAAGQSTRVRTCTNPAPSHGGSNCDALGEDTEVVLCNTHDCPSCPDLRRPADTRIEKIVNETTGMQTIRIHCTQSGYSMDLDEIICGPLTNWTWSHVTDDNPEGVLPQCTKAVAAASKKMSASGSMEVDSNNAADVGDAIKQNAEEQLNCAVSNCTVEVTATSAGNSGRKRRNTPTYIFEVAFTMDFPTAGADFTTATASEAQAQLAAIQGFETAAGLFVDNIEAIFNTTVGGVQYMVDPDSIEGYTAIWCLQGYEPSGGFCIACGPGTFWYENVCVLCRRGQYQDQSQQMECLQCPQGTTTLGTGSQSIDFCLVSTDTGTTPGYVPNGGRQSSDSSSSEDAILIGLAIGCSVVFILIVLAVIFIYVKWKQSIQRYIRQRRPSSAVGHAPPPPYSTHTASDSAPAYSFPPPDYYDNPPMTKGPLVMGSAAAPLDQKGSHSPFFQRSPRPFSAASTGGVTFSEANDADLTEYS